VKPITADLIAQRWQAALAAPPAQPFNRALYGCLRTAILDGSLPAGTRLPASRELAAELSLSRNTVIDAYGQLLAEGYLRALTGSGTYVAEVLPEQLLWSRQAAPPARQPAASPAPRAGLSRRGRALIEGAQASPRQWGAFVPGVPDIEGFPHRKLAQITARLQRRAPPEWFSYAAGGHAPLREALALHLRQVRSVMCQADQILITEGVHQAVDLVSRVLADAGDHAWMEEPGYWGIRGVLASNGLRVHGVPVDNEGLDLTRRPRGAAPRLIFVTPSHQYPLGAVMSLPRRQALLELARQHGSWVIEDDYDSEFRFAGHPIPALQGLAPQAPVIYIGTFSKTLYPGLRVAYMVLPEALVDAFRKAHGELYREGHLLTQAALAAFVQEGHYAAHIRRMRLVYAARRAALLSQVRTWLGKGWLHPHDSNAGLHLVLSLPEGLSDTGVAQRALARDVVVRPLSPYYAGRRAQSGLLLGFGCVHEDRMREPFERLLACLAR